jgi:hypothetical protein
MIKYAKIENEETKVVSVAVGTDTEYYESIGMTEMDVEHCDWNGNWYVSGYVPTQPEPSKEEKIAKLKGELDEIDEKSARSMRAILAGVATDDDRTFLAQLEARAEDLRRQIRELEESL